MNSPMAPKNISSGMEITKFSLIDHFSFDFHYWFSLEISYTLNRDEGLLFLESIFLFFLCAGYLMERRELGLFYLSMTCI